MKTARVTTLRWMVRARRQSAAALSRRFRPELRERWKLQPGGIHEPSPCLRKAECSLPRLPLSLILQHLLVYLYLPNGPLRSQPRTIQRNAFSRAGAFPLRAASGAFFKLTTTRFAS